MRLNARPATVRHDLLYSVASATRTLPYVGRIAADVARDYARWRTCVREFEAATGARGATPEPQRPDAAAQALRREARHLADDIRRALDDLGRLGIECRDLESGLLDFPALVDGTPAALSWRPGEEAVAFWRRRGSGVAGRRPLDGVTVHDPDGGAPDGPGAPGALASSRPARPQEAS
jgi:hypothetical protein